MEIAAREAEARDDISKVVEDMETAAEADAALQAEMVGCHRLSWYLSFAPADVCREFLAIKAGSCLSLARLSACLWHHGKSYVWIQSLVASAVQVC